MEKTQQLSPPGTYPNGDETEQQRPHKPDDDQLAVEIAKKWRNGVAHFRGNWHTYQNGCWQQRYGEHVKRAIREVMRRYSINISLNKVNSVTGLLAQDLFVENEKIDATDNYINLQNGLYNLTTHELEPHRPEVYSTSQLNFAYDPDADAPMFRRFLNSSLVKPDLSKTDYDLIKLVQEAMGYSLTTDTSYKTAFWLVGESGSGKSTLIATMIALAGSSYATINLNKLGSNNFMLSGIVGKRLVTCTESDTNTMLSDADFKTLVGGSDEIWTDVKFRDAIAFRPVAKLWWGMNHAPRSSDRSGAVENRLRLIRFNRVIPEKERILDLDRLLLREQPGIFVWAMEGLQRLKMAGKFTEPEQSRQWLEDFKLRNDTERTYILERIETGEGFSIYGEDLYSDYYIWCKNNGFRPKNNNEAAKDWERLGFHRTRQNGRSVWHGLRLRST